MERILINGIEVFIEESERYVQVNDIEKNDLKLLWEVLRERFPGYELTLCFHNMMPPKDTLTSIGAEVLEDCLDMRITQTEYAEYEDTSVSLLEKSDFFIFSAHHDKINPDCGATSKLIWSNWDNWRVFLLRKDNEIIGYTIISLAMHDNTIGEVYALEADCIANKKSLLSSATRCAFANNKESVVFMVDKDNINDYNAAKAIGYKEVGYYIGYNIECIH